MTLIASLVNFLLADVKTLLIGLLIFYVVYRVTTFYRRVYSLPPGPFPLPYVGNLLYMMGGSGQNQSIVLANIAKRYGPVSTVWLGENPRVMVTDIDLLRDKFKKTEFAGRKMDFLHSLFFNDDRQDIVFSDYGPKWEALRRVAHAAVLKYAVSEQLNDLVIDCVDHTVDLMVKTEGLNKPFVPFDYIFSLFLNINAASAFGKRYELDDPEYKMYERGMVGSFLEFGDRMGIWESFPVTRFGKRFNQLKQFLEDLAQFTINKFVAHYKDYDENVIRDFCDALIAAKNEAIKAGKDSASHLVDTSLAMSIADLFFAGTDTSQMTFRWSLLHMLHNKEFEEKLRHEIDVEIGDRMPTHEDKRRCHYVMAFISETLRHSNVIPVAVPHKAMVTAQLGDYMIPKDTEVLGFQKFIMHQEEHFPESHVFRPERFLQRNGSYVETKNKAYIPFGAGRRTCLGEKMAIADLFLVLVHFIQKTNKYRIVLHMDDKEPLLPDPKGANLLAVPTKDFKISLMTR